MGRLFDGPWPIIILFFILAAAVVVAIVLLSTRRGKRSRLEPVRAMPFGHGQVDQRAYARGLSHRSTATVFGVIGLFILGIVFGPLALVQAGKAEALGVKATAGKVLGWICVGFAAVWVLVILNGLAHR